ncbi:unnamed protein product [Cylicocyclus nassatus]|uniref:Peptidase A1 domain-containing protein n=1 Tax=Cylicocyclus nassatus TaxID=53992 RepID=A0AA36M782_CYLNA|nr:unnamed protein product [Cylicocyclus nassatus]
MEWLVLIALSITVRTTVQQVLGFTVPLYDAGLAGYSHKLKIAYLEPAFEVLLTTTSSMLWIPHINCTTEACENKKKFNSSRSSSFKLDATTWQSEKYGANGVLGIDTIVLYQTSGTMRVMPYTAFGMATNITVGDKTVNVPDGALGLSFRSDPGSNSTAFISQAKSKGYLYDAIFTVYLKSQTEAGEEAGMITYGSQNFDNCAPIVDYHSFSTYTSYQFQITTISLGRIYWPKKFEAVPDLHKFIIGPYYIIAQLAITAGAEYDEGFYWIDCNATFPDLEIKIGSMSYYISSEELILRNDNDTTCMLAMKHMRRDVQLDYQWSFGAPFIQSHCISLDFGRKRLGIARMNYTSTTTTVTRRRRTTRSTTIRAPLTSSKIATTTSAAPRQQLFIVTAFASLIVGLT